MGAAEDCMDRSSWIFFEKIYGECSQKDNCPIEDLAVQLCEFLKFHLSESLWRFFEEERSNAAIKEKASSFEEIIMFLWSDTKSQIK